MEMQLDDVEEKLQAIGATFEAFQQEIGVLLADERPKQIFGVVDCGVLASGTCAHAEGQGTLAAGTGSHAEGGATTANGFYAHAEGGGTSADGDFSHAAGALGTDAAGQASHAEGLNTRANGDFSHAEGGETSANGPSSHAEGAKSRAEGGASHVEGSQAVAEGVAAHAEGSRTRASKASSHAEGSRTRADGFASHAEGAGAIAHEFGSHAQGISTEAVGQAAHSEGFLTLARGAAAHAEGLQTVADGTGSHAEGLRAGASGDFSHAEGEGTDTNGLAGAHIMGKNGSADVPWSWFLANGGFSSGAAGLAAKILSDGRAIADVGWFAGVADYAELFEATDRRPLECGYFVTLDGEQVRQATADDAYILGITSANPAFVGDSGDLRWKDKFQTDEWGRIKYREVVVAATRDSEGVVVAPERTELEPVLNPEWDSSREYVSRLERPEWVAVALMGKVLVRDDGTCQVNGYCRPGDGGIATSSTEGFRVMKRTSRSQILVLLR